MRRENEITELLNQARNGNKDALNALFPLVYAPLREMAHQRVRRLNPGETMNTTAIVHELYLKIVDQTKVEYKDRSHFMAVAAMAMRHILINYAREKKAIKRGGHLKHIELKTDEIDPKRDAESLLILDDALQKLKVNNDRQYTIVIYKFYGGMTEQEISEVLKVATRTIRRDWFHAKIFLSNLLK